MFYKISQNKEEAALYYKIYADKGYAHSIHLYADMNFDGNGIEKNKKEAARYFKLATDGSDIDSLDHHFLIISFGRIRNLIYYIIVVFSNIFVSKILKLILQIIYLNDFKKNIITMKWSKFSKKSKELVKTITNIQYNLIKIFSKIIVIK